MEQERQEKKDYWIELATEDLRVAKSLLKAKHLLYCGYFCHQTFEKTLKAIIANKKNIHPPKIHDLKKLTAQAEIQEELSQKQISLIDKLNPLQIEARYPKYKRDMLKSLSIEYCKNLVKETEDFLCWVKKRLSR